MITYRAVNTRNGKWYVGSTVNFERRKREHLRSKAKSPFYNALRRDPGAFVWEVLEEDERDDRLAEDLILAVWFGSPYCYNLNSAAVGFSAERARAVWQQTWGNMDPDRKREHYLALNQKVHGEKNEHGHSVHAVTMGRKGAAALHAIKDSDGKSVVGRKMAKIVNERKHAARDEFGRSIAAKNNFFGKNAKRIKLTNIQTGQIIFFRSSVDAALELGLNARYLRKVAAGQRPRHKGWYAEFVD